MTAQFMNFGSSFKNETGKYLVILGYTGSFVIQDANGNQADSLFTAVPAGILPPSYILTGGTRGYGVLVDFSELEKWI